jgi:hypothetical protein
MSKLGCICGHSISDGTDQLPYKATFFRDFDHVAIFDRLAQEIKELVDAVVAGDRASWERRHYLGDWSRNESHGELLCDFVCTLMLKYGADMFECESCGRLWVQRPGTDNEFAELLPAEGKCMHLLKSNHDDRTTSK